MSETVSEDIPAGFADEAALEDFMTRPGPALVRDLATLDGDIMILGAGGKMGPTLARLARRAAPDRRIIAVARFSDGSLPEKLRGQGVETIACDLLDREAVAALPRAANIIFMAGRKFGTAGKLELTWAMNVHVPAIVAETFTDSRIVAFSTGNIYPFVDVEGGGATEATPPGAMGEYAQSCLGRERMFEYFSARHGTPGRIFRLNYAIDMRYGVLCDIAARVRDGVAIDLAAGHVNVIWQGDANSHALRLLAHCTTPTTPINVSGPDTIAVRDLAAAFGERFGRPPVFTGTEADTGWLVNTSAARKLMGPPSVPLARMIDWVADWMARGGASLEKPTAYDSRDGSF